MFPIFNLVLILQGHEEMVLEEVDPDWEEKENKVAQGAALLQALPSLIPQVRGRIRYSLAGSQ